MKKSLVLLTAVLSLLACTEDELLTGAHDSLGFVSEYRSPDEMIYYLYNNNEIFISIIGKEYAGYKKNPADVYVELAKKYGDTKEHRVVRYSQGALTVEPDGITVVSDTDIPGYPAGTPLDDMILIFGWTYKEYIDSRYTYYTKTVENDYGYAIGSSPGVGFSPFIKYLSEIKKEDLVLMCSEFYLLPQGDWPQGEYNLTITMFGEDFQLSGTVTCTVEE